MTGRPLMVTPTRPTEPAGTVCSRTRHCISVRSSRPSSVSMRPVCGPRRQMRRAEGPGSVALLVLEARREHGSLGPALHAELRKQVRDVVLHRLLGEEHPLGDLAVGEAFGDEIEDSAFLI